MLRMQDPSDISEARSGTALGESTDPLHGISSEKDMLCMASGRVIKKDKHGSALQATQRCKRCRHQFIAEELPNFMQLQVASGDGSPPRRDGAICPLCHDVVSEY